MNAGRRAILVVTDDSEAGRLIAQACRKARLPNPLKIVATGDAAIAYLNGDGKFSDRKEHPLPLLLLLDLDLPKRAGYKVLAWTGRRYWSQDLVILGLAGREAHNDFPKARRFGATSCLAKPIDFGKLCPIVKILNRRFSDK